MNTEQSLLRKLGKRRELDSYEVLLKAKAEGKINWVCFWKANVMSLLPGYTPTVPDNI